MARVEERPDDERGRARLALPHFYCIFHVPSHKPKEGYAPWGIYLMFYGSSDITQMFPKWECHPNRSYAIHPFPLPLSHRKG